MKIWILFGEKSWNETIFFDDFLKNLQFLNKDNILNIYNNSNFKQIFLLKKLIQDKNNTIISFDLLKPIFYNKNVFQVVSNLEKLFYPDLVNTKFINKYSYLYIVKSNLKKAKKIICYSEKTKKDLNEKLNISEEKIKVIAPFFYGSPEINSKINIKNKHQITWEYLIYDCWVWNNKNIKRLLEALFEINKTQNLNLIFIWNEISCDLEIRNLMINLDLKDKIIFVWIPLDNELWLYYKQSIWVIYPVLYDDFPISLSSWINYNCPIIASQTEELNKIFENSISYFSWNSSSDMSKKIKQFIKKPVEEVDYSNIIKKYNTKKFINNLFDLIKKYE